jgi:hypothetical protein
MQGADLGGIASSLSPTMGSLGDALERIFSSASVHYSQLSRSSLQRVYVAFAGNSDLCLSFLRHCADYGEKVTSWCLASTDSPTCSPVGRADLRKRISELQSEETGVSAENAATGSTQGLSSYQSTLLLPITDICGNYCFPGSRRFKITYKKAVTLEQKTTSRLNTLIENLSSWAAAITDGPSDDTIPGIPTPQQLGEVKLAWENARDSVRAALAILTSESAQRVALMRPRSAFKRWMKSLVCFS